MKQLILSQQPDNNILILSGKDFHYLVKVQRKKVGDKVNAASQEGIQFELEIQEIDENHCTLMVLTEILPQKSNLPQIDLFQCIPKGKKMDSIIRQTTEGGISAIFPVSSQYSIPDFSKKDSSNKLSRWNTIAKEAAQQSGTLPIPQVTAPKTFQELVEMIPMYKLFLYFHQEALEQTTLHEYLSTYPEKIALLVGPEGGLSNNEIDFLNQQGAKPVHLGPTVLRTETAGIYALGAVRTTLLEYKKWQTK